MGLDVMVIYLSLQLLAWFGVFLYIIIVEFAIDFARVWIICNVETSSYIA